MRSWPIDWGCLPAGRWSNAVLIDLLLIRGEARFRSDSTSAAT